MPVSKKYIPVRIQKLTFSKPKFSKNKMDNKVKNLQLKRKSELQISLFFIDMRTMFSAFQMTDLSVNRLLQKTG